MSPNFRSSLFFLKSGLFWIRNIFHWKVLFNGWIGEKIMEICEYLLNQFREYAHNELEEQ